MPPPGMGPGGMVPPRAPVGPVPGGPPPPPPGMSMPPPPPPLGGLGPASPLAGMLADLSASLTPGWQAVDMAVRCLRVALRAEDMQRAEKVVAVLQSQVNVLTKLISAYTAGTASGVSEPSTLGRADEAAPPTTPEADAQPASASLSEGSDD